jgi:hypothetical protein
LLFGNGLNVFDADFVTGGHRVGDVVLLGVGGVVN